MDDLRKAAPANATRLPMPSPSRFRTHGTKKRAFLWAAFLPLILLSGVLASWAAVIPPAFAAPNASVSTPGHNTFQQFQQEGKGTHQSPFQRPSHDPGALKPDTSTPTNTPLPSAEPAKMKDLVYVLDDSFVLNRPAIAPGSQPAKVQGQPIPA
jgi:hypothetical protein